MTRLSILVLILCMSMDIIATAQTGSIDSGDAALALNAGFEAKKAEPLSEFLQTWSEYSTPIDDELLEKKPNFEQAVYAMYSAFFEPAASLRGGEYVVIQEDIKVRLVDTDLAEAYREEVETYIDVAIRTPAISEITIHNFRPRIEIDEKTTLYYDHRHIEALLLFLMGEALNEKNWEGRIDIDSAWDEQNGGNHSIKYEIRAERLDYLNSSMEIIDGHWGNGWHIATHPDMYCVVLSVDLDEAVIYSRIGYSGEAALMKYLDDEWVVAARHRTGTE
jgi:hypothetical protein